MLFPKIIKQKYSIIKNILTKDVNVDTGKIKYTYIYNIKEYIIYEWLWLEWKNSEYIRYNNDMYSSRIDFNNNEAAKTYLDNEILKGEKNDK